MLPLSTRANVRGVNGNAVLKVLTSDEAIRSDFDPAQCLIWQASGTICHSPVNTSYYAGVISPQEIENAPNSGIVVDSIKTPDVVSPGDVVRLIEGNSRVSVLYRRGSNSNTLFSTERCNSYCLMCSQPPREVDDSWLVDENLKIISLVDPFEHQLGISGGEPTLLGDDLLLILHQAKTYLPDVELHILSNGRHFSDDAFARSVCAIKHPKLTWGIPLYSDCPEMHDYIVQARGAWDETVSGLFNLARFGGNIEIRVVVQQVNFERLGELAYFIFRNLTFVDHVAFMGLEPIGFARSNFENVWVDPVDCMEHLSDALFFLANRGMNVSLYNYPLCNIPNELWRFSRKSISDWKNTYVSECENCEIRKQCCGFFRSTNQKWIGRGINPTTQKNCYPDLDHAGVSL